MEYACLFAMLSRRSACLLACVLSYCLMLFNRVHRLTSSVSRWYVISSRSHRTIRFSYIKRRISLPHYVTSTPTWSIACARHCELSWPIETLSFYHQMASVTFAWCLTPSEQLAEGKWTRKHGFDSWKATVKFASFSCHVHVTLILTSLCRSDLALIYNDRAVLENYHVSAVFRLMKDEACNIISGLKKDEYKYVYRQYKHWYNIQ